MRLNNSSALLLMYSFFYSAVVVDSFKYLAVLHSPQKSHFVLGESLVKALVKKGHEVHVISSFPQEESMDNYYDIPVKIPLASELKDIVTLNQTGIYSVEENSAYYTLDNHNVQQLLTSNHSFDAVICNILNSESLYGLSDHFDAPLIGLSMVGVRPVDADMVGSPTPPSYLPHFNLSYDVPTLFLARATNLVKLLYDKLYIDFIHLPKQDALYKKYFPNAKRDMYTVIKNTALVLVNSHVSFGHPRPYMPNHIEVGGMHINQERKPLPWDIQKFMEESEHGVIYVSLGSILEIEENENNTREAKIEVFLKVFKNIKQRVLWSCDNPVLSSKFKNIFASSWLPQNDILAYENVKVFITNGGPLSMAESVYHGIPIIAIPRINDLFSHTAKTVADGFAVRLSYENVTVQNLSNAIHHIIGNQTYTLCAKELSERYKDQPLLPMDLAVFWVEHIAQFKGAKYLHCTGLDLNFFQYHNIDAMFIIIATLIYYIKSLLDLFIPFI